MTVSPRPPEPTQEASHATGSGAAPVPWTREQIEAQTNRITTPEQIRAWLKGEMDAFIEPEDQSWLSDDERRDVAHHDLLERAVLYRLAPEAGDYGLLVGMLEVIGHNLRPLAWILAATPEEIERQAREDLAALWARSLSDERSEEAPCADTKGR